MLRLAGCAVIFICCTSLGMIKASVYGQRRREIENTLELIRLLELEISYRKETLSKAFEKTASMKDCWMSNVLSSCADGLRMERPLSDSWKDAIDMNIQKCPLTKAETDILMDISMGLGRSDVQGQAKIFAPALIRLEKCLEDASVQERKQGRMYRGMGVAVGIAVAVVMI